MLRGPTLAVSQVLEQPRGRTTLVTQAREGALRGPTLAVFQVLMRLVQRSGPTLVVSQTRVRTKDFLVDIKDFPADPKVHKLIFLKGFSDKVVVHKVGFLKGLSDKVLVHKVVFLKGSLELLLLLLLRMSIKEQEHLEANLTVVFTAQTPVLDKLDFLEQVEAKLTEASLVPMQVRAKLDFQEQVQIMAMEELQEYQAIQPSRIAPFLAADSTLGFPRQRLLHILSLT